ncbi:MAG: metallophosphoesterase family protein, partial [Erysipelotrichaceae bacterium]|nr:metallophosphoesterase family protein [Erysipelotrichaceae bacterium]
IMADYLYMYIEGIEIYASHGHIYNQNKPLPGLKGIFLCGHTHVPLIEKHDDFVYLNPGSVSIPKDGSRHSYMIFENREFLWKDLENKEIYMNYKV